MTGHEQQYCQHQQQLDADQEHSDRNPGLQRNSRCRERQAPQDRKGGSAVGQRVDADAEPRHAVTARNADQAEQQDDRHIERGFRFQHTEVVNHHCADQTLQQEDKPALGEQVRLAGCVDQLRDFSHRRMHGQLQQVAIHQEAEQQAGDAHYHAAHQQRPLESEHRECRNLEVRFPGKPSGRQQQQDTSSPDEPTQETERHCTTFVRVTL